MKGDCKMGVNNRKPVPTDLERGLSYLETLREKILFAKGGSLPPALSKPCNQVSLEEHLENISDAVKCSHADSCDYSREGSSGECMYYDGEGGCNLVDD